MKPSPPAANATAWPEASARARRLVRALGVVLGRASRASVRGAARVARASWRHRGALGAVFTRVGWWVALAAWSTTAAALLGTGTLDVDRSLAVFAAGAVACVAIVALGGAARIRWLGASLGTLHGTSAVVLWFVANA